MATTTNKAQQFTTVFNHLRKQYEPAEPEKRPVLEQLLYALCREGATRGTADKAFQNLRERFFDWNEVRVSSAAEVAESLDGLPDADARAERIIGLLQEVFEANFKFDLEDIDKKGLKVAAKALAKYKQANDYAVAWVIQQSLGGHAMPLDAPTLRVLRRLGLLDSDTENLETLRGSLEHLVPKAKAPQFGEMVSLLARDVCWEDGPNCPACPLKAECPVGQERHGRGEATGRATRLKPR
jgi:endonuclease III